MKKFKQLIYLHTCIITDKSYTGQTIKTMEERLKGHIYSSDNGSDTHFHRAIRKYGIENFTSEVLEDFIPIQSDLETKQTLADQREIYFIEKYDTYNNGYNETEGGKGVIGLIPWNKGKTDIYSEETINLMSEAKIGENHHMYGKKQSKETIRKRSESLKGNQCLEETRKILSYLNSGEKHPLAKIIKIYNDADNIMFKSHGNFKKICEENCLPYNSLKKSYQNNGSRLYSGKTISGVNPKNIKFKGWYAKEIK